MIGILTKKRYKYATVYVDQYSGMGYTYLKKYSDTYETIQGKNAFAAYCNHNGVRVKEYHANNGIFRVNKWVDECRENQHTLTFAGVNDRDTSMRQYMLTNTQEWATRTLRTTIQFRS